MFLSVDLLTSSDPVKSDSLATNAPITGGLLTAIVPVIGVTDHKRSCQSDLLTKPVQRPPPLLVSYSGNELQNMGDKQTSLTPDM